MRDGALWIFLLIGAASLGTGWTKGWEALRVEVETVMEGGPIVPEDGGQHAGDSTP
jgi:hypothetical protein